MPDWDLSTSISACSSQIEIAYTERERERERDKEIQRQIEIERDRKIKKSGGQRPRARQSHQKFWTGSHLGIANLSLGFLLVLFRHC